MKDKFDPLKIERSLGLAVIGASKFAEFCLEQYQALPQLRPVAVWSRTPAHAAEFAHRYRLRAAESLPVLLADDQIDIVHVAATPAVHAEHTLLALQAGKHVLCEKPLATTLEDARQMQQMALTQDRRLGVNFMMRFGPLAEVTRQIVNTGVLGVMLRGMVVNCAGDDGLPPDHWFWKREQSGGIFIEHGVHFFDLVRSWLGDGRAKAAQQFQRPGTERVDQVSCEVYYPPQSSVSFYHGFHQPHHLDRQRVTLIFERGELTLHGWVADTLELKAVLSEAGVEQLRSLLPEGVELETVRHLEGKERVGSRRTQQEMVDQVVRATWRDPADKQTVYGRALKALMLDFIHSIQDPNYQPEVTVEDGLSALKLAVEADRLAQEAPDE